MAERQITLSDLMESFFDGTHPRIILTANGGSMAPTLVRGDRIHLETTPQALLGLARGDIVLARDRLGRYLIHRIREIEPVAEGQPLAIPRIITRGDALDHDDPPLERVLAKVTRIERTWRSRLRRLYIRSHALST